MLLDTVSLFFSLVPVFDLMLAVLQGQHPDARNRKRKTPGKDPEPIEQAPGPGHEQVTRSLAEKNVVSTHCLSNPPFLFTKLSSVANETEKPASSQARPIPTSATSFPSLSIPTPGTSNLPPADSSAASPYFSPIQKPNIANSSPATSAVPTKRGTC